MTDDTSSISENPNPVVAAPKRSRSGLWLASFCLLLILCIIAALGYFFNRAWQMQQTVDLLEKNLSAASSELQQQQQTISSLQSALQSLSQPQAHTSRALAEAEYMVQLAQLNLTFEGNVDAVLRLLKGADAQLAPLNDPMLLPIRQLISNHITTLETANRPDLAGTIVRLNTLSQLINQLPIVATQITKSSNENNTTTTSNASTASFWQRGLDSVGHALKEMVVVRRSHQPAQPLISPEQQVYLTENIQLQLSQAQWAVLHQQPQIYQQSLSQALRWVQQYFVPTAPQTQQAVNALTELQKVDIKPNYPDLTDLLKALQNQSSKSTAKNPSAPAATPGV